MIEKNRLEAMEHAISEMMQQIADHKGIKRQNSYIVLAHILSSYSERCIELSIQSTENGKRKRHSKQYKRTDKSKPFG